MNHSLDIDTLGLIAHGLDELVLALGPEGVVLANPAAREFMGLALEDILGAGPGDVLQPPPAQVPPGSGLDLVARINIGACQGAMVRGRAVGLAGGLQLWLIQGRASLVELGALTAGLAHNLAGPLSVIRSTAELASRYQEKALQQVPEFELTTAAWPESVRHAHQTVVDNVDDISEAVRDLLAKLRGEAYLREAELDLNQILTRELRFAEDNLGLKRQVAIAADLDPELPPITGLYSDFSQSLRNIITNAVQAMEGQADKRLVAATRREGREAVVTIEDNGPGVSPQDLERIFEPFYTSRGGDAGSTGLGLSSARQLLEPYGGRISAARRSGHTEFTLRVPAGAREKDQT